MNFTHKSEVQKASFITRLTLIFFLAKAQSTQRFDYLASFAPLRLCEILNAYKKCKLLLA